MIHLSVGRLCAGWQIDVRSLYNAYQRLLALPVDVAPHELTYSHVRALEMRHLLGRSGFDLSVSGRPPTSSEAAGPLEKKQNKHCFLAVTPPLSTWWVDQARRRRKFYGGTTLKITFSILLADRPLRRDISDGSFSGFWF